MEYRLIPLNINPGARSIGIGEVLRKITGKAVMSIFKKDELETSVPSHLCTEYQTVCEVAVHP